MRENQTSQVGESLYEKMETSGLAEIIASICTSQLSGARVLWFLIWGFPRGTSGSGCRVWFDGGHHVSMPSPPRAHCWHRWNMMA